MISYVELYMLSRMRIARICSEIHIYILEKDVSYKMYCGYQFCTLKMADIDDYLKFRKRYTPG